jgi:PhnB protein
MGTVRSLRPTICSKNRVAIPAKLLIALCAFMLGSATSASAAESAKKKVDPVPKGFHTLTASLQLKNAFSAIEYYKKAFGAKQLELYTTSDGKKVVHAELKIGDSILMLNDDFSNKEHPDQVQTTLHMSVPDVDKAFEQAISAGAKAEMPLQNMFWGDRYGELIDPFGQRWSMSSHIEDVAPDEINKRAREYFEKMKMTTDESIKQADTPK